MSEGFAFLGEQAVELRGSDVVSLQQGPGIAVGILGVDGSNDVLREPVSGLVVAKCLEGAGQNDPAEVPHDRLDLVIHHTFTLCGGASRRVERIAPG